MGTVNQILCLLKEVNFGQFYFEMTSLFRNSMLLNGMLHSIEALHGLKQSHVDQLESCDKYLLRKAFNSVSTTATEAFYIELGILLLRFTVAQKLAPLKNDWVEKIKDDLKCFDITEEISIIKTLSKYSFKKLIKQKSSEIAFK